MNIGPKGEAIWAMIPKFNTTSDLVHSLVGGQGTRDTTQLTSALGGGTVSRTNFNCPGSGPALKM